MSLAVTTVLPSSALARGVLRAAALRVMPLAVTTVLPSATLGLRAAARIATPSRLTVGALGAARLTRAAASAIAPVTRLHAVLRAAGLSLRKASSPRLPLRALRGAATWDLTTIPREASALAESRRIL